MIDTIDQTRTPAAQPAQDLPHDPSCGCVPDIVRMHGDVEVVLFNIAGERCHRVAYAGPLDQEAGLSRGSEVARQLSLDLLARKWPVTPPHTAASMREHQIWRAQIADFAVSPQEAPAYLTDQQQENFGEWAYDNRQEFHVLTRDLDLSGQLRPAHECPVAAPELTRFALELIVASQYYYIELAQAGS